MTDATHVNFGTLIAEARRHRRMAERAKATKRAAQEQTAPETATEGENISAETKPQSARNPLTDNARRTRQLKAAGWERVEGWFSPEDISTATAKEAKRMLARNKRRLADHWERDGEQPQVR